MLVNLKKGGFIMLKKSVIVTFFIMFNMFICGSVFSQSCPDVVGQWDVTGEQILGNWRYGEDPNFDFTYQQINGIITITDQQACLFHGWLELGAFKFPLVGTIKYLSITMVSGDAVLNARLRRYDRNTELFTMMNITAYDTIDDFFELPPEDTFMSCSQGTGIRKLP
jgi:hypothetical protein